MAAAAAPAESPGPCGVCGDAVLACEQHIGATCTVCGEVHYHTMCVTKHMTKVLRTALRATAHWDRREQQLLRRPQDLFAYNGKAQKIPVTCPKCKSGTNIAANVIKPPAKAPAKAAPKPPAKAPAKAQVKKAAEARMPPRQYFFPPRARMCRYLVVNGECRVINCEQCHSREQVLERRAEYLEQRRAADEAAAEAADGAVWPAEAVWPADAPRSHAPKFVAPAYDPPAPKPPTVPAPWAAIAPPAVAAGLFLEASGTASCQASGTASGAGSTASSTSEDALDQWGAWSRADESDAEVTALLSIMGIS
jgi:hypothetical protein